MLPFNLPNTGSAAVRRLLGALLLVAIASPALAGTVKITASPNGSRLVTWVQDESGPATVTAALKSTRIVAFGVIDSDGEIICLSVTNGRDRAGHCTFDAIAGELYAVLAVTASGTNKIDVTIQSGGTEQAFRLVENDADHAVSRMVRAASRAQ